MNRNKFIQDMFLMLFQLFLDEMLEDYDVESGEKKPKFSDHYLASFEKAAEAAEQAAEILETSSVNPQTFWY